MIDLLFALSMLLIIFGAFYVSLMPYVNIYLQQGYSKKDAFLMVWKDLWM